MNVTKIAVLLTCHNRREKTITCLKALFLSTLPAGFIFNVFLVDDGSTDGTGDAVKDQYPQVNVIQGTGNLYWNQGMRLAWETANKKQEFDYYFWLNDDTILDKNAIIELLHCSNKANQIANKPAIIAGACRDSNISNEFSYGGRTRVGAVIPNGELQSCKYINGNAVLVPKAIYKKLGNLSPKYTHAMGDNDYGQRALENGFHCYTTKTFIATCPLHEGIPSWCNPKTPLKRRFKLFHSPKGLNIKEYIIYRKEFWKWKWIFFALKAYLKVLFPSFYNKISKY